MNRSFFEWVIFLLGEYWQLFLQGTVNTVLIAVIGTSFGFLIGLMVAIVKSFHIQDSSSKLKSGLLKILKLFLNIYIQIIRGTPMMVQAMLFYYGAAQYFNITMDSFVSAILIVSVNTGAYMAEIIRGGVSAVDPGQTEAALSIGMSHFQTMSSIVLPQAIRNIIPSIGNEFIVNIKDSSVLNVIMVSELFFVSSAAAGTYLRFFESFFIAGCIYLILTLTVSKLMQVLERKMDGPESFTVHGSQSDYKSIIENNKEV